MLGQLVRQVRNVTTFKAYSPGVFIRELGLFPLDYTLRGGRSSSIMNAAIFITLRCNLRCTFCNVEELLDQCSSMKDPSRETIGKWLDGFAPYRPNIILFGGEPFIRKDVPELLGDVRKRGMTCGIFTNGMLVTEKTAEDMERGGLDYIVFSIHGNRENHNSACVNNKAFDRALEGLAAFDMPRRRVKVIVNCVLCEENLDALEDVIAMVEANNADAVRFGHPTFYTARDASGHEKFVSKRYPGEQVPGVNWVYDITPEISEKYIRAVERIQALKHPKVFFTPELSAEELRGWYNPRFRTKRPCMFVWRGVFVYPNGDVVPCESIGRVLGNLNEASVEEVWNGEKYVEFRNLMKTGLTPGCARCCKL